MRVRLDLNLSLDGVAAPADPSPDNPMGEDWGRLVQAHVATRTFRERVLHDGTGAGTTGVDDRYAAAYFEGVGAEVMGAAMFGLHSFPDDPDWRGWWGEEPPYHAPVFVLTHHAHEPIEMTGGTTFWFVTTGFDAAFEQARAAAGDQEVTIAGGASTIRQALAAGVPDELTPDITPVLLGGGERLFDGVTDPGLTPVDVAHSPRTTHVRYRVGR